MRKVLFFIVVFCGWSSQSMADDSKFSKYLFAKFQVKACTNCHDFHIKKLDGLIYNTHKDRTPDDCSSCHDQSVTGFNEEEEWFAQPGLYTSKMDSVNTCKTLKKATNAKFKSKKLYEKQLEKHLFEDPRVLWGIDGATPNSGNLPDNKKEEDLVKGGLNEWKAQVKAWIKGGMKCE
jgi:hypothetical protein